MGNKPVYRYPPRSHAYSCRCDRCLPFKPRAGDAGIIGPAFAIFCLVAVLGFWPAMVWHGEGGPSGTAWRWDIHSTYAELAYWGVLIFIFTLTCLGNRQAKTAPPVKPASPGPLPPRGTPPAAVPAPGMARRARERTLRADLRAADDYIRRIDAALSEEALDRLEEQRDRRWRP